ncbi:MAG: GAF domain-containing sensor histidine kinase [Chloroflexi bacterium]|nr:GAF domain-containing sensor histidine kinase [Chloroflexota bacterium]
MATTHNLNHSRRAIVEAELATSIATLAATEADLARMLQGVLEYLRDGIAFTSGSIALIEGDDLITYAADGPLAAAVLGQRTPRTSASNGHGIASGPPFIASGSHAHQYHTSSLNQSHLAVPLSWRGQPLGLLELESAEGNAFSEADTALAREIATLLGGPIELARQIEQRRRESAEHERTEQRLAVQYEITTLLAEAESFPQITPALLHTIATVLGWDIGCVWCIDRDAQVLRCSATWISDSMVAAEFQALTEQSSAARNVDLPGRVWHSQQPQWIADLAGDTEFLRGATAVRAGLHSAFSFPICGNEEIFGSFEFFSCAPRQPDEDLLKTAAALGRQIGGFIDRRRAETARKKAEATQHFLVESTRVLGSSLEYETTLQSIAHMTIPSLADWCVIDLLQDDGTVKVTAVAHVDPAQEWLAYEVRERYTPNQNQQHTIWRVLQRGRAIVDSLITDADLMSWARDGRHLALLRAMNIGARIVAPLLARGRILGTITLLSSQSGRYHADDRPMAEDLGHRAALAIDNARLYQEAQAAIEMRNEFLSIASHELKTPLTTLLGHTQGLQRRLIRENLVNERDRRALSVIEQQALRLTKQIDTLLDLSRIELGQFNLDAHELDLAALLRRIVVELEPTLERHTLQPAIPEAALLILGDTARMEQVIQNLLQNAIKYSPNGGAVVVGIERQDNIVVLTVSDQGVGIPEAARPYLFQRFYRADNVTGRNMNGMGIGLYLVNLIVTLHHGAVEYSSTENQGSTFTVRLPLHIER